MTMEKDIFHECICTGQKMTWKEWAQWVERRYGEMPEIEDEEKPRNSSCLPKLKNIKNKNRSI